MAIPVLVLIHLQPGIVEWSPLSMIDRVTALVSDYISRGFHIFVLELEDYPPTAAWMQGLLCGYAKAHYLRSELTDGSLAISQVVAQGALDGFETTQAAPGTDLGAKNIKFEVGGLFSYACVFDTVVGLSSRFPAAEVVVIESACDSYLEGDWSAFQSLPGVAID